MVEIVDEVKKEFVKDLISKGKRPSTRAFDEMRKITIERDVLTTTEGSARVHWGKTQVLVGVKIGMGTPFPDKPTEGVLSTNAELLPLASPTFEMGPPDATSIELARVVDRGIRHSGALDLASFFVEKDKVLCIYVDIYVLDHDGNLIDASALAAMAALMSTKMPRVKDGAIVPGQTDGMLKIGSKVVATTFAKIGNTIVVDADLDEEKAVAARITISTTKEHICSMQKGLNGGFTRDEVANLIDLAFKKGDELRALL